MGGESEHLNSIEDLSHAPLAYIKEALEKSEVAVRQLNNELRAEREQHRQMEEALQHLADELTQVHGWMDNYERQSYISQLIAVAKDPSELATTRRLDAGDSTEASLASLSEQESAAKDSS